MRGLGWCFAEAQEQLVVALDDVVQGEANYAGERLGVEKDDAPGDPGAQGFVLAGQQLTQDAEALLLAERAGLDHGGRQFEAAGAAAGGAPKQEGSQGAAVMNMVLGVPSVDLGLAALVESESVLGEPCGNIGHCFRMRLRDSCRKITPPGGLRPLRRASQNWSVLTDRADDFGTGHVHDRFRGC
ncbi:hypothetical protein [Catenulispora yoronensis]|uniref:hypothetical protein n=1 Tax=Catenulispora yoronensis TaxID=450799 RepID=UPI0031D10592